MDKLPKREDLFNPLIQALNELGGSGTNDEINQKVIDSLKIPNSLLELPHLTKSNQSPNQTQIEYELAWVRTMLKNQGVIENSRRGVWSLKQRYSKDIQVISIPKSNYDLSGIDDEDYKKKIIKLISEKISPAGFERLIQRFLREKGFTQVEITGRSGDGGIDGKGIAKINGILSFHIIFQCKRYKGKVTSSQIRDFRGAMTGRTDKGLFITSGSYTRDAIKEATRDGAPTIDLIDGVKLAEKLKELSLGVKIETKEIVKVDEKWFEIFFD